MNSEGAFIAPNGLFMYLDGAKDQPAVIDFQTPTNWTNISTSLKHIGGNTYRSADFTLRRIDNPTKRQQNLLKGMGLNH